MIWSSFINTLKYQLLRQELAMSLFAGSGSEVSRNMKVLFHLWLVFLLFFWAFVLGPHGTDSWARRSEVSLLKLGQRTDMSQQSAARGMLDSVSSCLCFWPSVQSENHMHGFTIRSKFCLDHVVTDSTELRKVSLTCWAEVTSGLWRRGQNMSSESLRPGTANLRHTDTLCSCDMSLRSLWFSLVISPSAPGTSHVVSLRGSSPINHFTFTSASKMKKEEVWSASGAGQNQIKEPEKPAMTQMRSRLDAVRVDPPAADNNKNHTQVYF